MQSIFVYYYYLFYHFSNRNFVVLFLIFSIFNIFVLVIISIVYIFFSFQSYVVGLIIVHLRSNFGLKFEEKKSFEEIVSSLTNDSQPLMLKEFGESFNKKWEESHGSTLELIMGNLSYEDITTPSTINKEEEGGDRIELLPLFYPLSSTAIILPLKPVNHRIKTSVPKELRTNPTSTNRPAILHESIPGNSYGDLLFYLKPADIRSNADTKSLSQQILEGENSPLYGPLPNTEINLQSYGNSDNPLSMSTSNGRLVDLKNFLKWSTKKLIEAIYPYYHK